MGEQTGMSAEEITEKLAQVKRLYDEAAALVKTVAEDQAAKLQRGAATLGIGAHLSAVADGHTQANAALLLATATARSAAGGDAPPGKISRKQRKAGRKAR